MSGIFFIWTQCICVCACVWPQFNGLSTSEAFTAVADYAKVNLLFVVKFGRPERLLICVR